MSFSIRNLGWVLFLVPVLPLSGLAEVVSEVDAYHQMTELSKRRDNRSYGEVIQQQVRRHFRKQVPSLGGNESLFSVPAPQNSFERMFGRAEPVSLLSHSFCQQTESSLTEVLRHTPSVDAIELANEVSMRLNGYREKTLTGSFEERLQGRREAGEFFTRMMGCLAYAESLTTADTERSKELAKEFAPKDYERPTGVKFYYDKLQENPNSRLNIGLYQFSPDSRGNVRACIDNWNRGSMLSSIPRDASVEQMIKLLGDPSQSFNAFCGMKKIVQVLFVQVNSTEAKRTHPENWLRDSSGAVTGLKPPSERCVSLHFNGRAYNHFGPLQNSTRKNLEQVLRCALDKKLTQVN